MSYLTYDEDFQNKVIQEKLSGKKAKDICLSNSISIFTLYKILHMNNKMPIPSQASKGISFEEGVEHRSLSPNNNDSQEYSKSTWSLNKDRHKKIKFNCLNCKTDFYTRDRGERTKFCCKACRSSYRTKTNSVFIPCDNCRELFRVKNSQKNSVIHCPKCRGLKLGSQSSKMSRQLCKWLAEEFDIEKEKSFDWFFDINKNKGRFKLDYFLPVLNIGIEYDGEQHFKPSFTGRWESVVKVQSRDRLKTNLCAEHGIKIIRFRYDEKLSKDKVLIKIYAELQENELVEVEDKKLLR